MFNTLKYARILEEAGFSKEQAETSIKILVEIMEDKLASKQDLQDLKIDLKAEMDHRFHQLEYTLVQAEHKLTIRMGTMFAATIAILTAIQKLT